MEYNPLSGAQTPMSFVINVNDGAASNELCIMLKVHHTSKYAVTVLISSFVSIVRYGMRYVLSIMNSCVSCPIFYAEPKAYKRLVVDIQFP